MKTVFCVYQAGPANGTYDSLEEARAALRRHGYISSGEYASCEHPEFEIEYWVDVNQLPECATTLDQLKKPELWLDRYLGDGAFAPQIHPETMEE